MALYHPQAGFYADRGSAGRNRDFLTSPEVGHLFGQVLANAIDKWWRNLGRPNPFFVFEGGAGSGTLAAGILAAGPACAKALRYVTVERSLALRSEQTGKLDLQPADIVLDVTVRKPGPLVAAVTDLPTGKYTGVVLANELLDNLAVELYQRNDHRWQRVGVGLGADGGFAEVLEPLGATTDDHVIAYIRKLAPSAKDGTRVPIERQACDWLVRALELLEKGRVIVFDYMRTTNWMAVHEFDEWCRTYRNQRPGGSPLELPGTQDITCEVAVDQLARVRAPDSDRSQAQFLDDHYMSDLVSEAREAWHGRAAIGDLGAMKARSRVQEGRALSDLQGLGRYRVLEWKVDGPESATRPLDDENS